MRPALVWGLSENRALSIDPLVDHQFPFSQMAMAGYTVYYTSFSDTPMSHMSESTLKKTRAKMRRSLRRAVVRTSELLSLRKTSARDLWDRENHQIRIMDMADMESWISQTSLESFAVRHSTRDCMFLYTYSVAPVRRVLLSDSFQL